MPVSVWFDVMDTRPVRWLAFVIGGMVLGAAVLGFVGGAIGDAVGTPEGHGFIGFHYGVPTGAVVGALLGAWFARGKSPGERSVP